jgi:hypothetical protein
MTSTIERIDEALFADLWERGCSYAEYRRRFGLHPSDVARMRRVLGLESRNGKAEPGRAQTPPKADVKTVLPNMPPHPFWTPLLDLQVMATRGAYPAVEELARALGKPRAAVLQRWHRLRAA